VSPSFCPDCGAEAVAFTVPERLGDYTDADSLALCRVCLRTHAVDDASDAPDFTAVIGEFPEGDAGIATALLLGKLGSLALNRADIVALCAFAEREGADVLLTLDRLAASGAVEPHFDIDRRRPQLRNFLDSES
jgi:hypothetical protein